MLLNENIIENGAFAPKEQMLHFHNIFQNMIFQRPLMGLLCSKGLNRPRSYLASAQFACMGLVFLFI